MDAYTITKWERSKELAKTFEVKIETRSVFTLFDKKGLCLGSHTTVGEVYAFLCGYEHSQSRKIS